jgi:cytochrome bd-type quinol oxidase subunit 2
LLLALPAFAAIWSGWVGLGELTGFGVVHPLPGIFNGLKLNTAITLPIGVETYAAYALRVWLSGAVPARARRFARNSAIGSLVLGAAGQVAYHLMAAARVTAAPWWITTLVAALPVAVLGMGAALAHLIRDARNEVTR